MCGIAGFWLMRKPADDPQVILCRMTDAVARRGPDDRGQWLDESAGIGLGHRRLSILDLSAEGHQPMFSASGRFVMVFNGEVYNFEEIRNQLPSQQWRGHSDTEVMLAAIEAWGLTSALARFVGMFAFALWDRQNRTLQLVRDRLGIKPLYYGWQGSTLLFGSELKVFRAFPGFEAVIDRAAVALFLRHNYVPSPYSIYKNVRKLTPGTVITLRAPDAEEEPVAFWSARAIVEQSIQSRFEGTEQEAIEQLEKLLMKAVGLRMIADVPLGAFLSGGVDSSAVVALMQAQSSLRVHTFSLGFTEPDYNEAPFAAAVARHLGTDHTELYVTPSEAQTVIPKLPSIYDEPFADSSQIPTFLISELARRQVTVALSGDGGDELFGGYTRYLWAEQLWRSQTRFPAALRGTAATIVGAIPHGTWERLQSITDPLLPRKYRQRGLGDKAKKLSQLLRQSEPEQLYYSLISHWPDPEKLVPGAVEPKTNVTDKSRWARVPTFVERMMYLDLISYLPDDILMKVDRASMAVGLEARVPLLDHRVVEFAWKIPLEMKVRDGSGKRLLRQVLYRYVPEALIERPKTGFGIPIGTWLRSALRDWAEDLLSVRSFDHGYISAAPVREKWEQHLSGRQNWHYWLWNVLMFQAWHREQYDSASELHSRQVQADLPLAQTAS